MSLSGNLKSVLDNYESLTDTTFVPNRTTDLIRYEIIDLLKAGLKENERFLFKGSAGQGRWAETPWIAILNNKVTKSTQNGFYVSYLFDTKSKVLYLCLAVGWTQFAQDFTPAEAANRIEQYGSYLYAQLVTKPTGFKPGKIDLSASGPLTKGYESGQILSKRYVMQDLNDDSLLIDDLQSLIDTYDELSGLAGDSIKNIEYETVIGKKKLGEQEKTINKLTLEHDIETILEQLSNFVKHEPPQTRYVTLKKAVRNPKIARLIKEKAGYICELCGQEPFMQKNGKPYAEADHIKALGEEGYDSADNMRCLCPRCHSIVTHGSEEEKRKLISK